MVKKKEDRSDWVAVAPEFSSNKNNNNEQDTLPKVTAASSAYQIFQRENYQSIKSELISRNATHDLASLTKAVSAKWHNLPPDEKKIYEDKASEDRFRFMRESHLRDVAAMEQQEKKRKQREEILLYDDDDLALAGAASTGKTTRGSRRKMFKKISKEEKKKLKQIKKEKINKKSVDQLQNQNHGTGTLKLKMKKLKKTSDSIVPLSDSSFQEDDQDHIDDTIDSIHDSDSDYSQRSSPSNAHDPNSSSSSDFDSDSDSSDDDSDSDDDSHKIQNRKRRAPPQLSQATIAKRQQAKREKEAKDTYIAERQQDLRSQRAQQAKKRLDFLLKQSDIFRHFGQVKEDSGKFYNSRSTNTQHKNNYDNNKSDLIHRGDNNTSWRDSTDKANDNNTTNDADLEEADEHDATYLTTQPSTLGFGQMRPYQIEGLNWMIHLQENGVNGILADEMGLGKTLQSISMLVYMMEFKHSNGPHLIVVPKSTLSNWMNELERWAPTLQAVKFHGSKEERFDIATNVLQPGQMDDQRAWHVCVTTYEVCNLDKAILNKFAWSYLIIDEAHRLKNEASAFSQTIRTFETKYRLLLTGTPLQNNLHELWALLNFLVPDVFASAEQFDDWFNLDIDDADEKNKLISQLHKILRPFMIRRLKVDVEKSLPPKHETILFTGMSALQKKLYKDILMRDIDVLQGSIGGGSGGGSRTTILNIVMQLRKCAGHPYLFPGVEDRSLPPLGEHLVENCGKMVLLDKLLIRLHQLGHRVLLFTQMTRIMDILEDYMIMRKFKYCRIDGNTDYDKREDSIDTFNAEGSDKFIFLLSTRAGGLGINLQTADVVILYDSDWNPQADLQAQDRAHRIGQKKPVQVFRLVTEHSIEEKVVERAQQKLKLDAMVVQQGRLKEKDKLSREELLEAVRFGADKVFKSKDSSITDDDIDMILEAGLKKTQELNDKLMAADKGDMLDFKLDGGGFSAQTFEGVDYSKKDFAQIKSAQAQAELLGMLDMGKRERRTVANYNEAQLYRQQIESLQGEKRKESKKKEIKLPKYLRLPRLDEWQMFDREKLYAIQDIEERAFKALPEELQLVARGKQPIQPESIKEENDHNNHQSTETKDQTLIGTVENQQVKQASLTLADVPQLLDAEQQDEKDRLLAEGFADWGRTHYTAFIKASAMYGRNLFSKIAPEVGKPQSAVEEFARAFWDENIGKKRISENEYDRVVKAIERGEKKLQLVKVLETGTRTFLSLFENPWRELEFTHVNCKDKLFTQKEDRHLICWAHKYGYGQWEAVKMAIRRSPDFRFDYYLRSLPIEAIGKRCEQLMKAADKEVEIMYKKAREDAGFIDEKKEEGGISPDSIENIEANNNRVSTVDLPHIELPTFKQQREIKQKQAEEEFALEKAQLESKVEELENQMEDIQKRLQILKKYERELEGSNRNSFQSNEFPDDLLHELANLVARSGHVGVMSIAHQFIESFGQVVTKKVLCAKIEDIAKKEKRVDEGDTRAVWHLLPEYRNLVSVETLRHLRKEKEQRHKSSNKEQEKHEHGAIGPDGDFVPFPDYDGENEPRECKKAFTLFCNGTRREVKASLVGESKKDREKVNSILKDRWLSLSQEEKTVWRKWEVWDAKRYERQLAIFEAMKKRRTRKEVIPSNKSSDFNKEDLQDENIPKKKRDIDMVPTTDSQEITSNMTFHIPKKKRL